MRISVIIPVYNDAPRLAKCLDALSRQTMPADQFEVLVVDNGSDDEPETVVSQHSGMWIIREEKPGSYAARNAGLRATTSELIAFTDADCIPEPAWLEAGVAELDRDPDCAMIGGDIEIFPVDEKSPNGVELYDIAFGLPQEDQTTNNGRCMTANLFTRRSVFDQVGYFDETAFSVGDYEWSGRVSGSGSKVTFLREAKVKHPARLTLKDLSRQARRHLGARFDRPTKRKKRPSLLHRAWVIARFVVPNFMKMGRSRRQLRLRGYNGMEWIKTIPVILAIQYTQVTEIIRKVLGKKSERR